MDFVGKLVVYNRKGDLAVIWKPDSTEFTVHRVYGSTIMSGHSDTFTHFVRGGPPDIWEAAQFAAEYLAEIDDGPEVA